MDFYERLEMSCIKSNVCMENEFILFGDFNTNLLLSSRENSLVKSFQNFSKMLGLKQLINEPTRVTATSQSTLDLILVSEHQKISQAGVLDIALSDHNVIFCTRKISKIQFNPGNHRSISFRRIKTYSCDVFNEMLSERDWSDVLESKDVDDAWSHFKKHFLAVLDVVAPMRETRIKQNSAKWMTSEILNLIRQRDSYFRKFKKTKQTTDYEKFIYLRNQVRYSTEKAKSQFYVDSIAENAHQPKKLWKVLGELGSTGKTTLKCVNIGLVINGLLCYDKWKVANHFNKFFTTVAECLVDKLPCGSGRYGPSFVNLFYQGKKVVPNAFVIRPVSVERVRSGLSALSINKATGLDLIPARFLRDSADTIASVITYIVNLSISQGKFPSELKMARVAPLFKKNCKSDVGNYRPVSILTTMSKILERLVYEQVEEYLVKNKLLYELQSGFRSAHSTETCLINLVDFIKENFSEGNYVGMILLDLQKAFDTVNHAILLSKLQCAGFSQAAVKWFTSYVTGRTQVCEVEGARSTPLEMVCGVPQGSILGPLLFLLYVNDMPAAIKCKLLLYADDSALLVPGNDVKEIECTLSKELENARQWLIDNRLSIHLGKTESILFGTKRKLSKINRLKVSCNGADITSQTSVLYLGVTLEQSLSCEAVALKILSKCAGKLKFLYRKTRLFDLSVKKMLSSSLVLCHLDYACSAWYSSLTAKLRNKLQVMQHNIIRYILDIPPRTHIGFKEFQKVSLLPVHLRVEQLKLHHMFNIINGTAPCYMDFQIVMVHTQHGHNTRASVRSCKVPRVNRVAQSSFFYSGISLWNSLPLSIKLSESRGIFRGRIHAYLWSKVTG